MKTIHECKGCGAMKLDNSTTHSHFKNPTHGGFLNYLGTDVMKYVVYRECVTCLEDNKDATPQ